jgi:glycosyltransferase involved in cell wall biosynthesis
MNDKKKKILFCIHDLRGRGAEKVLATILKKLDREKYQASVFVYHDDFVTKIQDHVNIISAHIPHYPLNASLPKKIKNNIHKVLSLFRTLRSFRPDIALSISGTNITLMLAKYIYDRKLKVILSEHTMASLFNKETENIFIRYLTDKLISLVYPLADLIITPSKAVFDDLASAYQISTAKISVIPNPLDIEYILNSTRENSDFTFPDDNSFRIGFIGGLSREKNVPCLIKTLGILKKNGLKIRLFLIGEGDERENLENLSQEISVAEYVHFLGFRENPYAILHDLDVLVVSSFFETFSYVMLEAMACGVPVISTKWKGCEDIYRDMENCLLVPIDDPENLAHAIERIMNQKEVRENLIRNGFGLANKCDVDSIVKEYERAINSVLTGRDPGKIS